MQRLTPFFVELGESPVWSIAEQALYFVDISGRAVHRFVPVSGAHRSWPTPSEAGCLALIDGGRVALALRDGFHELDLASGEVTVLAKVALDDLARMRFNDGRCDRQGRFWAGSFDMPRERAAAGLWRLARGELSRGPHGFVLCNGLAFSPDGRWMYFADTLQRQLLRLPYDPERGLPGEPEPWRRFGPDDGFPDGAAVDAEGGYWIAMYEAGCVLRLDERGRTTARIDVPVPCPTMPCFGGPDLKTLYVTTSRRKRSPEELQAFPASGAVFAQPVGVAGLPEPAYRP